MAISERLKTFLDAQNISYKSQKHTVVYTAQEIAAAQHVPGRQLAKCVLVTTNAGVALAVLPATFRVEFGKLKALLGAKRLSLASEADIKQAFPDVEVGAMSVFGNLYGVPVIVEQSLTESAEIVCNAGTHSETITVSFRDFERSAHPKVGAFGMVPPGQKPKAARRRAAGTKKKTAKTSARKTAARKPAKRTPRRKR